MKDKTIHLSMGKSSDIDPDAYELPDDVDTSKLKSVCFALGPYRNLTTITASSLALHPRCQVLNHAGIRIRSDNKLRFLISHDNKDFEEFIKYAISASLGGMRGDYGGSIIFSHAFDDPGVREAYRSRFGDDRCKKVVECLFWKESLLITNYIRNNSVDLDSIFAKNSRLRFMMPVRNPMDCAISNIKTGHMRRFDNSKNMATLNSVLHGVLNEILWFVTLQHKHPDRFFTYYEHSINADVIAHMAVFLELYPEEEWINSVLSVYKIKSRYDHHPGMIKYYQDFLYKYFSPYPDTMAALKAFV